jgi:hypothetical protein
MKTLPLGRCRRNQVLHRTWRRLLTEDVARFSTLPPRFFAALVGLLAVPENAGPPGKGPQIGKPAGTIENRFVMSRLLG